MSSSSPYCLVLGGGGAKGVYHVGVWKALQKLNIDVNAFVGNSIGALMAAILAQGDDKALERIADTIELSSVFNVPDELVEDGRLIIRPSKIPFLRPLTRDILKHHGIDTSPLRKLLETYVDEERLRNSDTDFGIQTFNLSDMRPGGRFVDEMEPGMLIEYLLASSALPGFIAPIIKGKKYVDGGVYDNVPYAMARRRGYRRIIVVDITGPGVTRRPDIRGTETVYIKNSMNIGGVLDFNRQTLDDIKKLGFLDTLRTFGRLSGYRFFIEPDERMERRFLSFLESREGHHLLADFMGRHGHKTESLVPHAVRMVFPKEMRFEKRLLLVLLDCTAHFLDIPRIRQYSYEELFAVLRAKQQDVDMSIQNSTAGRASRRIKSIIRGALKKPELDRPIYYYFKLLDYLLKDRTKRVLKARVSGFFPTAQAAEFLLTVIDRF